MVIKFHLEGESELGAPQPAVALLLGVVEDELSTKGFQIISHYLYNDICNLKITQYSRIAV